MANTSQTATRNLVITREFNAPQSLVWKAWTDPEHYKKWWGPKDFTCPYATIDLRVGGKYLSSMRAPDGKEFWSTGVYKEITPMSRLVYTDHFADEKGNIVSGDYYGMPGEWGDMLVTIELEEINGKTKMTLTHTGLPAGELKEQTDEGWNQSFNKMEESFKS